MKHRNKILSALTLLVLAVVTTVFVTGAAEQTSQPIVASVPLNAYAPEQPIPYSHKLHAGDLQIDCQYCHTYARRSRSAGIPSMEQCMACHTIIAATKPDVQTINQKWNAKEAIEWVKVHDIPDFVYFSHKRHVSAGFECQDCHGPVEEMEVLYREAPMTMGWCVNCHQDNQDKGAKMDCLVCHK